MPGLAFYSLLSLSALALLTVPARSACNGQLTGDGVVGGNEYDPFDTLDFRHRQAVSVRNTGSASCDFLVVFRRQPVDAMLGPALHYHFEDSTGNPLLNDPTLPYHDRVLSLANVQPGQGVSVNYYLAIPRGQFAFAGTYYDNNVVLQLFGRDRAGTLSAELDTKALSVGQTVKPVVDINVAGGGLRTTLNFDTLTNGKERTVKLQTRANYAYTLALSSANASHLKLEPGSPGQVWSIPYSLRVDNMPVSLQATVLLAQGTPVTSDGRENHLLSFRIEDASSRRAGTYRDSVTVNINVRP